MTTDMYTTTCCACFITFSMPAEMARVKKRDHSTFYCPSGHGMSWPQQSEEEKLRLERDRLKQQLAQKDDEIRDWKATANSQREQADRLRKRVSAGVCPCCSRHFTNLERHMKTKHGDKVVPIKKGAA